MGSLERIYIKRERISNETIEKFENWITRDIENVVYHLLTSKCY